jgi:ATP-dependent Clp protease ATP-binding subunit ClpC
VVKGDSLLIDEENGALSVTKKDVVVPSNEEIETK